MVAKILLINPIRKKRGKKRASTKKRGTAKRPTTTHKPRTKAVAKRKTAKRKTAKRKTATHKAPARRRVARTARGKKRARKNVAAHKAGYYPNPIKRRRVKHRRRSNPIMGGLPSIKQIQHDLVMPALSGAAGAIVLDAAWANLPIPANIKAGYVGNAVKLAGAVLLTALASKVVSKKTATDMGVGMITIQAYNMARKLLAANLPGLQLGGDDAYNNGMGWIEAGMPVDGSLNEYLSAGDDLLMHSTVDTWNDGMSGEEAMGEYLSGDEDYNQF
jgi:hypothetical protein